MKNKIVMFGLVFLIAVGFVSAAQSGAIWTTLAGCGDEKQDVNHYAVGDAVYINGANFKPGTYSWDIIGKPGRASTDPRMTVASGNVVVDSSGSFCFNAYTIPQGDSGEYGVHVDKKSDNYRVTGARLTCQDAISEGLLTGYIDGNQAYVNNEASNNYQISFITYQMYSGNVFDQTPFDWVSAQIGPNQQKVLFAAVPGCSYQTDLVCGEPILGSPYYGDSVIASTFGNQNNLCTPADSSSGNGLSATVAIAPSFPQNHDYVFVCNTTGFSASSYSWYYGDGQTLVNSSLDNVFHTYDSGTYTVACRATDGVNWAVGTLGITVA